VEVWVADFMTDVTRLDEELQKGENPARIRRQFNRLDSQAGKRFYLVDIELRRLCEDLRRVGQPLVTILRMIE
jgi:hypothetical protein